MFRPNGVSYAAAEAGIGDFIARYRFPEKFMAFCRECGNYGANWACPPFDIDADDFLRGYTRVYVFGVKAVHSDNAVKSADSREKAVEYLEKIFREIKSMMLDVLFEVEKDCPETAGVSAGGCSVCLTCARGTGTGCRFPNKQRRSLESLGFDISMIADEMLSMKLLWMSEKIPEYSILVNALFSPAEDDSIMNSLKLRLAKLADKQPMSAG